jgi:hypothetical protein
LAKVRFADKPAIWCRERRFTGPIRRNGTLPARDFVDSLWTAEIEDGDLGGFILTM